MVALSIILFYGYRWIPEKGDAIDYKFAKGFLEANGGIWLYEGD